jgi:hypothetical protein
VVCNALVVSARWHRNDAAVDDPRYTDDARGHDAPGAADTAGHDATTAPGGHVFCLTAPIVMVAMAMRLAEPHRLARTKS